MARNLKRWMNWVKWKPNHQVCKFCLPPLARYTGRMCNLLEAAVKIQLQMFRSTKLITKAHTHTNTQAHIIRRINNNNTRRKKREKKKEKKKKRNSAKIIIIIRKKNKLYTQPASKRNKNHKEAYAKERHKNKARTEELLWYYLYVCALCVCVSVWCLCLCVCLYFLLPLMSYERFREAVKAWTKIGSCFWSYLQRP